ncbi:L,D-transpeptidase family protein [Rhodobacterales bacterium LSUCC0031]|nr:L,D-transpeptidase family protein [Rhodobacterales bacterium LSUCC0031]
MGILLTRRSTLLLLLGSGASAGCTVPTFSSFSSPEATAAEVTRIEVHKSKRRMYLLSHEQVVRSYKIDLGFAPDGHKTQEGDGRTPEGRYYIDRRNPNSAYYLSIGISYPNSADRAQAAARGVSPGGDIFIHGTPREFRRKRDWTAGCIAVTDREMREIYTMVPMRTVIDIFP